MDRNEFGFCRAWIFYLFSRKKECCSRLIHENALKYRKSLEGFFHNENA